MNNKYGIIHPNAYNFDFSRPEAAEHQVVHEYFVDDEAIPRCFGQSLEPLLADLIDLALSVYLADRLALRRDPKYQGHAHQWCRQIRLRVPVRCWEQWARPSVHRSLHDLLFFMTEDVWQVDFVPFEGSRRSAERQAFLFPAQLSKPIHVALYSGGLDSFSGAFQHLSDSTDSSFVLVSGSSNTRQRVGQRQQVRAISKFSERVINHVIVPFGLERAGSEQKEEKSQRSRGFLFLSLGVATAVSAGVRQMKLYENGIGAINLPFDGTQLGTFNSRAAHPVSLLRMERFVSLLIDSPFQIYNPFLFCTKTEMCHHPRVDDVGQIIRKTFSCDSFPLHVKDKPQCGSCTSCLLRRMSLESAGLSRFDPSEGYLRDLLSPSYSGHAKGLRGLRAMEWQAMKLGLVLTASHPWKSLSQEFPELQRILSELSMHVPADSIRLQEQLLQLYSRYVSEWNQFSARERLKVCPRAA